MIETRKDVSLVILCPGGVFTATLQLQGEHRETPTQKRASNILHPNHIYFVGQIRFQR